MKSAHALRLPFALGPLSSDARKRKRRLLGAALALLLAGGALAAILLLRSPSGPAAPGPRASLGTLRYRSPRGWSMQYPRGMHIEHASASGISYAVDEVTFSSFRSKRGVLHRESRQGETIRPVPPRPRLGSFPSHGIALRVLWLATLGDVLRGSATPLPLHLSSFRAGGVFRGWYPGAHPRPVQQMLVSKWGQRYFVQVWTGRNASARQRAMLARMVASISVQRPRGR